MLAEHLVEISIVTGALLSPHPREMIFVSIERPWLAGCTGTESSSHQVSGYET